MMKLRMRSLVKEKTIVNGIDRPAVFFMGECLSDIDIIIVLNNMRQNNEIIRNNAFYQQCW